MFSGGADFHSGRILWRRAASIFTESALVHMVDAVVIRLEAMEQNVGQSVWNRDIVIYQTVNDFSSSEIYDHSGMSMNQFLKIREFLAKEELLR